MPTRPDLQFTIHASVTKKEMNSSGATFSIIRGHLEVRGLFIFKDNDTLFVINHQRPCMCTNVRQKADFRLGQMYYPLEIDSNMVINALLDFMATCELLVKC